MARRILSKSKDSQAMGPWRVAWERFRKNKIAITGAIIFFTIVLLVIIVPILSPYKLSEFELSNKNLPPSSKHWLGTDEQGRDILFRVFYGGRISIMIGLVTALITVVIGATVGAIAGFYGGRVDNILMRFAEMVYFYLFYAHYDYPILCFDVEGTQSAKTIYGNDYFGYYILARIGPSCKGTNFIP